MVAERLLTRSDTGLFSYPAFLFFLSDELGRWKRFGHPFSVILLHLTGSPLDSPGPAHALTVPAVREIAERIDKLKRKTDIFAHYETSGFALLLLETDRRAANAFGRRLVAEISKRPLSEDVRAMPVIARVGVACFPDDGSTLGAILARAKPSG
jgi:diguanylate cyclase (GGDEF)-like protein